MTNSEEPFENIAGIIKFIPFRETLAREMNGALNQRTIILHARTRDDSPEAENRKAKTAAWHVITNWLPRALRYAGLEREAHELTDIETWSQAVTATLSIHSSIDPNSSSLLAAAEESARKAFNTAVSARDLDLRTPYRGAYSRDRLAEDIAVAGRALAHIAQKAGKDLDLAQEYLCLLGKLELFPGIARANIVERNRR